jgi:hypothetical protein
LGCARSSGSGQWRTPATQVHESLAGTGACSARIWCGETSGTGRGSMTVQAPRTSQIPDALPELTTNAPGMGAARNGERHKAKEATKSLHNWRLTLTERHETRQQGKAN